MREMSPVFRKMRIYKLYVDRWLSLVFFSEKNECVKKQSNHFNVYMYNGYV